MTVVFFTLSVGITGTVICHNTSHHVARAARNDLDDTFRLERRFRGRPYLTKAPGWTEEEMRPP